MNKGIDFTAPEDKGYIARAAYAFETINPFTFLLMDMATSGNSKINCKKCTIDHTPWNEVPVIIASAIATQILNATKT